MARSRIEVTQTWQLISTGQAVFSVLHVSTGTLLFNEIADDITANRISNPQLGRQFQQGEAKSTYVRATRDGWVLLADGDL
jgi:hypothetical protein